MLIPTNLAIGNDHFVQWYNLCTENLSSYQKKLYSSLLLNTSGLSFIFHGILNFARNSNDVDWICSILCVWFLFPKLRSSNQVAYIQIMKQYYNELHEILDQKAQKMFALKLRVLNILYALSWIQLIIILLLCHKYDRHFLHVIKLCYENVFPYFWFLLTCISDGLQNEIRSGRCRPLSEHTSRITSNCKMMTKKRSTEAEINWKLKSKFLEE